MNGELIAIVEVPPIPSQADAPTSWTTRHKYALLDIDRGQQITEFGQKDAAASITAERTSGALDTSEPRSRNFCTRLPSQLSPWSPVNRSVEHCSVRISLDHGVAGSPNVLDHRQQKYVQCDDARRLLNRVLLHKVSPGGRGGDQPTHQRRPQTPMPNSGEGFNRAHSLIHGEAEQKRKAGDRWDRVEGRIESLIQGRVRSRDRGGPDR